MVTFLFLTSKWTWQICTLRGLFFTFGHTLCFLLDKTTLPPPLPGTLTLPCPSSSACCCPRLWQKVAPKHASFLLHFCVGDSTSLCWPAMPSYCLLVLHFTLQSYLYILFSFILLKKSMIWFPLCCCDKITLVWSKATSGRKGCISASRSQSITGGNQKQELAGQTTEELPDHLKAGAYTAWTQMPREQCHTQDWALLHPSTIKTIFHRHTRRLNWSRNYPTWDSLLRRPGQWFSTFL